MTLIFSLSSAGIGFFFLNYYFEKKSDYSGGVELRRLARLARDSNAWRVSKGKFNTGKKVQLPLCHYAGTLTPVIMSPSEIVLVDCPFPFFFYSLNYTFCVCAHLDGQMER